MRLTGAETPLQIGALVAVLAPALGAGDGALDEAQRILEAARELRSDHIVLQRLIDGLGLQIDQPHAVIQAVAK